MNPRPVALCAALLPFLAVHATYLVAASHGLVSWCVPYIDSCTSISATGRHPPASYVFRATMLPAAVVLLAYWWLTAAWLRARIGAAGNAARYLPAMRWLAVIASIGLVLYVTVLGEAGDRWQQQRRVGVILFFSFSYLAQLLMWGILHRAASALPHLRAMTLAMGGLCALLLLLGLLTVYLDARDPQAYDEVEDAFEWWLALLLQCNVLLGYLMWRRDGWRLGVTRPPSMGCGPT